MPRFFAYTFQSQETMACMLFRLLSFFFLNQNESFLDKRLLHVNIHESYRTLVKLVVGCRKRKCQPHWRVTMAGKCIPSNKPLKLFMLMLTCTWIITTRGKKFEPIFCICREIWDLILWKKLCTCNHLWSG